MKLGGGEGGGDSGGIAFPTFAFLFALASWEKKVFQLFGMFCPWKFNVVSEYCRLSDVHGTTFDLNFKIVLGSLTVYLSPPTPTPFLFCLAYSGLVLIISERRAGHQTNAFSEQAEGLHVEGGFSLGSAFWD